MWNEMTYRLHWYINIHTKPLGLILFTAIYPDQVGTKLWREAWMKFILENLLRSCDLA